MQATIGPQALPRAISRPSKVQSTETTQTEYLSLGASLVAVWRGAWQALVTRALPMLTFALLGCGSAWVIASFGIAPQLTFGAGLQLIAGTLALSFARGGIAWLALHGNDADAGADAGFVAACRAALARLPALLLGSLIYSVVITTGAVGLGLALRYARIDLPLSVRIPHRHTLDLRTYEFATKAARSLVAQSADALIPDPGAPVNTWLPALRTTALLRKVEVETDLHATTQLSGEYLHIAIYSPDKREFWYITAASIALLWVAEVVLRLRTVAVMQPQGRHPFASLVSGLRVGIKHFGFIAVHIWLLRLVVFGFSLLFIIVPVVLVQEVLLPKLMFALPWTWSWFGVRPLIPQAIAACVAVVSALFTTFGIAYEARLYLLLTTRADTVAACRAEKSLQTLPTPSAPFLPRMARIGSAAYPI